MFWQGFVQCFSTLWVHGNLHYEKFGIILTCPERTIWGILINWNIHPNIVLAPLYATQLKITSLVLLSSAVNVASRFKFCSAIRFRVPLNDNPLHLVRLRLEDTSSDQWTPLFFGHKLNGERFSRDKTPETDMQRYTTPRSPRCWASDGRRSSTTKTASRSSWRPSAWGCSTWKSIRTTSTDRGQERRMRPKQQRQHRQRQILHKTCLRLRRHHQSLSKFIRQESPKTSRRCDNPSFN